jgi:c-di-AMP phosphodiesterase-like protein
LTEYQKKIYVSSRSIDEIDVQLIMERLGGGGHLNVAGAQIEDSNIDDVKNRIENILDIMIDEGEIKL